MDERHRKIGFHYFPDDEHYTQQDLERWLPTLQDLDAGWLTLRASAERAVPEAFVRAVLEAGIEPVVHIDCPIGSVRPDKLNPLLYSYAHWGVSYVVAYDRPNLRSSWAQGQWSRAGLVDRFLDTFLPTLQAAHSAGLTPTLPPFEPGGDYWDTAFLDSALRGIARRGQRALLESLTLSAYGWTHGRSLDWGAGGPEAWPDARPYSTPDGCEDQRGFRTFEWHQATAQAAVGRSLPTLVIAGGPTDENCNADPDAGSTAFEMRQLVEHDESCDDLLGFCFYLLACEDRHPDREFTWYTAPDQPTSLARGYLGAAESERAAEKSKPAASDKLFDHYLLLPREESQAVPAWRNATAFALAHRPVVGFSPQEAAHAEQVTIAGDYELISNEVENTLRAAGCRVQRLTLMPSRKSACSPAASTAPNS